MTEGDEEVQICVTSFMNGPQETYRHAHELDVRDFVEDDVGNHLVLVVVILQSFAHSCKFCHGSVQS